MVSRNRRIKHYIKNMQDTEFKLGDRVIVSAAVTGYGEDMHGVVSDVEVFAKTLFVTVTFDKYLPDGTNGRTITNIGMITPEKEVSDKHFPEANIPENQQIREVCETLPELDLTETVRNDKDYSQFALAISTVAIALIAKEHSIE